MPLPTPRRLTAQQRQALADEIARRRLALHRRPGHHATATPALRAPGAA